MDIVLIIFLTVIITAIIYLLSRPLTHGTHNVTDINTNYKVQYRTVLDQIEILERLCDSTGNPDDMLDQLEDKRNQAAELFRLINPQSESAPDAPEDDLLVEENNPSKHDQQPAIIYCQKCGGRIAASDKFCTHCGRRLQP
jgi:hypothetical protein